MVAAVLPTSTTSQAVTWVVSNETGTATISNTGLLKAVTNGTVTVKATATDGSKVVGTKSITLSGQIIKAESIAITSAGDVSQLVVDGTLQMGASVLPVNTTHKAVKWSVDSVTGGTGSAIITSAGVLTGKSAGDVNVIATATDGSGIIGNKTITIIPQVKVTKIIVSASTSSPYGIITNGGTLQMNATIEPNIATNQAVTWSVEKIGDAGTKMTGNAIIDSSTGILTAISDGTVTVKATAKDGSGSVGSEVVTISNQVVKATRFTVTALDGVTSTITADKGTLQMKESIMPNNATTTPTSVTWSVEKVGDVGTAMTGNATIDSNGKLTAIGDGTVKVKVTGITTDGTVIVGSNVITISGQIVTVTGIQVTSPAGTVAVNTLLQMTATISPTTATKKTVTWSVISPSGTAKIGTDGKLVGSVAENVTVIATADDNSLVTGSTIIVIK